MATTNQKKAKTESLTSRGLVKIVQAYQVAISPLLAPRCRFYPSCSHYAIEAVEKHGSLNGSLLAIKRISKCHPLHPGGLDEVPCIKHK